MMGYRGCGCAGYGNGPTDPPYGPPPSGANFTCKDGSTTPNPTTCPEWGQSVPVTGCVTCNDGSYSCNGCQNLSTVALPDMTKWAFYGAAAFAGLGLGMLLAGR